MSSDSEDVEVENHRRSQQHEAQEQERIEQEFNTKFPNRPENAKETLPFHVLYQDLFDPLIDNLKRKPSSRPTGRRAGPHGGPTTNPREVRRNIIERFISRWRREVGDDFFPAMRLIIPEKDRERAMYGLKEKALAKYLVKLMKIDKNSDDAFNLIHWKLPGQNAAARSAGDFAGRCYEVLCKRANLVEPGNMTIAEVNLQLDRLSKEGKEENQLPIMEIFYKNMNAYEMTWLIRIITRSMKIGATERTILDVWHPDAEALFNISSSLRRVCWELYNPKVRLEGEDRGVQLWECYQPQLAHQPKLSFAQMVASMKPTEEDPEFWIEEKLDGERMQLHIRPNPDKPNEKQFRFWSRKGKDYSYLYGESFESNDSALTQYIRNGFRDGVESAILDGEMITWNSEQDTIVPFGTLKTAALMQQKNSQYHERPFYRVFDILLLNDQVLTRYTLRDRRKALGATINDVHRRMDILPYSVGTCSEDIERSLREVVANASEGLVLKNPRSAYVLNARLQDWVKVKPEYMTEFGESLDCLIIGGYYGSGHRGGELSSFLCGLREDRRDGRASSKFYSFFKVGGGMTTDDFAKIRHNTEGKWHKYDPARPPTEYLVLAGGQKQIERPDMWIKPKDSVVVEVKAASVNPTEDYAINVTLRFPRFTRFRTDKDWKTALSVEEFENVRTQAMIKAEENEKEAKMQMNQRKRKNQTGPRKKQVIVAGYDSAQLRQPTYKQVRGDVFSGLRFYIMTESTEPEKKSKLELEQMVKENGGVVVQSAELKAKDNDEPEMEIICIAERRTVKVASLQKRGQKPIIKPIWLFDCIKQGQIDFVKGLKEMVLQQELERHVFFASDELKPAYEGHVDEYGDSFARDVTKEELKNLLASMRTMRVNHDGIETRDLLEDGNCRGAMFAGLVLWFDTTHSTTNGTDRHQPLPEGDVVQRVSAAKTTARFAGALLVDELDDDRITHLVLNEDSDKRQIRRQISSRKRVPRVVRLDWIEECWKERTRIDEERFAMI